MKTRRKGRYSPSRIVEACRVCGSQRLRRYLDLGRTPLANSYLNPQDAGKPEFTEELCLQLCLECGLSMLTRVVPPDMMFKHYLYVSSTTETQRDHFTGLAAAAAKAARAKPGDLALDIASNDGCLLRGFQLAGLKPLGVDPAENLAAEANANGLATICGYWSLETASRIVKESGRPKIITANNVFAHVDDLKGFMAAVSKALAPGGLFIIECPYVLDFIQKGEFDTAYHEHLSYLGVTPLSILMGNAGFQIVDVSYFGEIHGGSIRVFCARTGERHVNTKVGYYLEQEKTFGVKEPKVYAAFARKVLKNRSALLELVGNLHAEGKTVWAYGASAKGNTLMNFFGLTAKEIPVAIDDNPKKWGYLTPGARMKISGIKALKNSSAEVLLLLAWNFEKEIRARCRAAGYAGDFIVPVPAARIVAGEGAAAGRIENG